jgi:hypothetical protein
VRRDLYVAPTPPARLDSAACGRYYRALLCSVGYESRSRAIAEHLHPSVEEITGVEFLHGHNKIYEDNRRVFDRLGADVRRMGDQDFVSWVRGWLGRFADHDDVTIAVDVSSMSRPRIAGAVMAIAELPQTATMTVDFLYAPARYEPAPESVPDATEALDPVIPAFAGAPADPGEPLVLIFGLGYEPERAASAVDEFAPQRAVPFFPIGSDPRFVEDIEKASSGVLALPDVGDPVCYAVNDPFRTFCDLEIIVEAIQSDGRLSPSREHDERRKRPLLLPLGPKIFAATCMLVANCVDPPVPVWRVSSGIFEDPDDREADGELVTLRVSTVPIPVPEAVPASRDEPVPA